MGAFGWKKVRAALLEELLERGLGFIEVRGSEKYYRKDISILCKDDKDVSFYVLLVNNGNGKHAFSVEIGWSSLRRPPELSRRPNISDLSEISLSLNEAVIRLSNVVDEAKNATLAGWKNAWIDYSYITSAEQLNELVESIIGAIEMDAFSAFELIALQRSAKIDSE